MKTMQTLSQRIDQLKTDVAASPTLPPTVKRVCLDVLYHAADANTKKIAEDASREMFHKHTILRCIGNANPKHVNDLLWESLPLIEEAVYGELLDPVAEAVTANQAIDIAGGTVGANRPNGVVGKSYSSASRGKARRSTSHQRMPR